MVEWSELSNWRLLVFVFWMLNIMWYYFKLLSLSCVICCWSLLVSSRNVSLFWIWTYAMERKKCCVSDCNATNQTYKLFCFPKNDCLRKLWLDFLVPRSSSLIGLTKEQLLRKYVCERHFDKAQYDQDGKRIRFSYPCLFSAAEIQHGMPLPSESK